MAYKIPSKKLKEKKNDGIIRKLSLRVFGFDKKWHNVYDDGYRHFFHYENNNTERVWDTNFNRFLSKNKIKYKTKKII